MKITVGVALAAGAATLARPEVMLACSEAIRHGEAWRLLTGPLVHAGVAQLLRDLIGFGILGSALEPELGGRRFATLLAMGLVVPVAAVALFTPGLDPYYGLSGVVYALLGFAVAREWTARPPRWLATLALLSVGKLVFEAVTGRLLLPVDLGHGVVPATMAHLSGAVGGVASGSRRREAADRSRYPGRTCEERSSSSPS